MVLGDGKNYLTLEMSEQIARFVKGFSKQSYKRFRHVLSISNIYKKKGIHSGQSECKEDNLAGEPFFGRSIEC